MVKMGKKICYGENYLGCLCNFGKIIWWNYGEKREGMLEMMIERLLDSLFGKKNAWMWLEMAENGS